MKESSRVRVVVLMSLCIIFSFLFFFDISWELTKVIISVAYLSFLLATLSFFTSLTIYSKKKKQLPSKQLFFRKEYYLLFFPYNNKVKEEMKINDAKTSH